MADAPVLGGQFNIGHICSRQQCELGLADKVAFRWISTAGERVDYTFKELDDESSRAANALRALGVGPGDVVATLLPKAPEVFFLFLGALKLQAVCCVLFANFGDDALLDRLGDARAKVIVTRKSALRRFERIRDQLPSVQRFLVTDIDDHRDASVSSWRRLIAETPADFTAALTSDDTPSVLHYTSGSTGKPKGVLHRHRSVLSQHLTAKAVLDLDASDTYWCTADQGWVTGVSYGIIGPWSRGVTQIHYGGGYDAKVWMDILQDEGVTVWYTAPTALRMLMREDDAFYAPFDLSRLRHVCSVGEPLNPEAIRWAQRVLGKDVHDTWWQTETGAIMIANARGLEIRPGSMGKPVPGIRPAISPYLNPKEVTVTIRPGRPSSVSSAPANRSRNSPTDKPLVLMTKSARARNGSSSVRSRRIPSCTLPDNAAGCLRRVSLYRFVRSSSDASR